MIRLHKKRFIFYKFRLALKFEFNAFNKKYFVVRFALRCYQVFGEFGFCMTNL